MRPGRARHVAALALAALLGVPACAWLRPAPPPPLWEQPPAAARDVPVVDASRLHRETLPNGLEVLVLEDHALPWVEMGVTVRRGIGIEPLDRAGLAELTAETMQRGAGERDALQLASVVDRLGATLAASADWDATSVGVAGLSRDRDVLFDVLHDVVLEPRFDVGEVERARAEQVAALEKAREDPSTLASWQLASALYPDHRYGLPTSGTPDTVAALDREAIADFHRRIFVPGNAILYAVGDVDPQVLLTRVRAAYGEWSEGPVPPPAPPVAETTGPRQVIVVDRPDLVQTQLRIGHEGIDRDDERRVAAQLVNTILGGGGFNSRLMAVVRSDEGLTYSIGSGFSQRRRPGPFQVGTFTRNAEAGRVVELVLAEMERLRSEAPPPDELRAAKSLSAGSFALALETSAAVAEALVELDVHGLPPDSLDTYRTRLRAVSPEQAEAVARELLHPDRASIVAVGPAETLEPLLAPFGPVQVVQP